MLKLKSILIAVLVLIPFLAYGQDWFENCPGKCIRANTRIITNRQSPCNQGGEAFMDFIPKFRTDKAFRDSRAKFGDEGGWYGDLDWIADDLTPYQKNERCDKSYGTWYNISENEVCFYSTNVFTCDYDEGGSDMWFRFQRIDGKWYITGIRMAG